MGNLELFLPESAALLGALVAFACNMTGVSARATWLLSLLMAAVTALMSLAYLSAQGEPFFPGMYRVDAFSQLLKLGIVVGLLLTLTLTRDIPTLRQRSRGDVPFLLFISAAGMMMLMSATELLTLYVALELSAYGLYILAALHKVQKAGSEAAAKYILYGAASSAVTLYGISLIFGATASTSIEAIIATEPSTLLGVGVLLALAGVLFKLAAFPFHAWAPDTYQAAPHEAVTFIATASKVAAIGIVARLVFLIAPDQSQLSTPLLVLCAASMVVGNLSAIAQNDLKRLLAYSTVAHAGYVLIGVATISSVGIAAAIYYMLVYVPIAFCAFLVVSALGADGSNPTKASLAGLYTRSPFLALTLLIGIFALAGIPPTAGFAGKWFLFTAALEADMFWLVIFGAANATISLYYYLHVIKEAYLTPPGDLPPVHISPEIRVAAGASMALVLITGIYPRPVWELAELAAKALTGS